MTERFGQGEVKPFQGFARTSVPTKRRKVVRSPWILAPNQQAQSIARVTAVVAPLLHLPTRLRSLQLFEYLGQHFFIYLDLLFVAKHLELCRFVNGPLASRRFSMVSKASNGLCDATKCSSVDWLIQEANGWTAFQRSALWQNRLSREQADLVHNGNCLIAVEQLLAEPPRLDQLSALPLAAKPHYRNLARRLLAQDPAQTLEQLGWQGSSRQAERFAAAFQRERWAAQLQLAKLCLLCQSRPIELAYPCFHRVTCAGCAAWKTCPVCNSTPLRQTQPVSGALSWQDCLLPKPSLAPPRLIDFFTNWIVCAWDGEALEQVQKPDDEGLPLLIKNLCERYPHLKLSDELLDLLMV